MRLQDSQDVPREQSTVQGGVLNEKRATTTSNTTVNKFHAFISVCVCVCVSWQKTRDSAKGNPRQDSTNPRPKAVECSLSIFRWHREIFAFPSVYVDFTYVFGQQTSRGGKRPRTHPGTERTNKLGNRTHSANPPFYN